MPKPNDKMNHGQLKDYIKTHGLNKGKSKDRILMGHKKPLMVSKLKAAGHWEGGAAAHPKKKAAPEAKHPKGKKKATMTKTLMNYDMDVSKLIGEKVEKIKKKEKKGKAATKIQAAARGRRERKDEETWYMEGFGLGGGYDSDREWDSDEEEPEYGADMPYLEGWEHEDTTSMGMETWTKSMTKREALEHSRAHEHLEGAVDLYKRRSYAEQDEPFMQLWNNPFD